VVHMKRWNSRYVSYAMAHGESDPEKMLARDRADHPRSCILNFALWNRAEWKAWRAEHPKVGYAGPAGRSFIVWQRNRAERASALLAEKGVS
jgi:hypothetical protein